MARRNSPDQLELFDAAPAGGRPGRGRTAGGRPKGGAAKGGVRVKRATPRRDAAGLHAELDTLLGGRLAALVLTRNHHSIVSARPSPAKRSKIALRLDECFLSAAPKTLAAVATWVLSGSRDGSAALAKIRDHYASAVDHERRTRRPRRALPRRTAGEAVDLARVYERLNRRYFGGELELAITWGRSASRSAARRRYGRSRSIQLGTYSFEQKLIRIHACLDHASVPSYVVDAVVYHEMVHAALPAPARGAARRILHPPEFRDLERRFERHREAEAWIAANFGRLLRRC